MISPMAPEPAHVGQLLLGSAVVVTTQRIIDAGMEHAAGLLEAAVEDLDFSSGTYWVKGTDRKAAFIEVLQVAGGTRCARSIYAL